MKQVALGVAFVFALCAAPAQVAATIPPSAAPAATSPPWLDPFCAVTATARQIDTSATPASDPSSNFLRMWIFAETGNRVDAHVTLISDTEAYDAFLQDVRLANDGERLESPSLLVALPKAMSVRFVYVDSFAINGGTETSCPSEPWDLSRGKPLQMPAPAAEVPRVAAVLKQVLPVLPCGKLFSNATVIKAIPPVYPLAYFDHDRSVQIEIFVDSNGNAIKTSVYKSSGRPEFDNAATVSALRSKYSPPMLLCTPVVGTYLFRADFRR